MYEHYCVTCRSNLRGPCGADIELPGDPIFVSDDECGNDEYKPKWPAKEWKADIACPYCCSISEFKEDDVDYYHDDQAIGGTSYLNVTMECFHSDCRVPVEFYIVDMFALAARWWEEGFDAESWSERTDWLEEIRTGRFQGKCIKGHELKPIPKNRYTITRKWGRLPSLHDRLRWGRIAS